MAAPLIGPTELKPLTHLDNHAQMVRIRRLSGRVSELLGAPQNYEVLLELQKLKAERKLIRDTMPPLRIVHSREPDNFKGKLCA